MNESDGNAFDVNIFFPDAPEKVKADARDAYNRAYDAKFDNWVAGSGPDLAHKMADGKGRDAAITVYRAWTSRRVTLFVKAIVTPYARTEDGNLIRAVTLPWLEILDTLKDNPEIIFSIPPRKWEEIIAASYDKAGFEEVTLTPHSGDKGRDVIAVKKGIGQIRVIDQVKVYKRGHLVTANDVRALFGVLEADRASKGFLTTTSDFAPRLHDDPLLKPFIGSRLELVNGEQLLKRLEEIRRIVSGKQPANLFCSSTLCNRNVSNLTDGNAF